MIEQRATLNGRVRSNGLSHACPGCHHVDRIEKVSGTVRRNSAVVFVENAYYGQPMLLTLARNLSPPEMLRAFSFASALLATVAALVFGVIVLLVLEALGAQGFIRIPEAVIEAAFWTAIIWFGVLAPLIAFGRAFLDNRRRKLSLPAWREACDRWSQLYYCSRDDMVFLPGEKIGVEPDEIDRLLYTKVADLEERGP
jgi:hypothetical protein